MWLRHVLGLDDAGGSWYLFWSGFAGVVPEFAAAGVVWRRVNCHARGCYRIGLHRVHGTPYAVCRKHHPDLEQRAATAQQIASHPKRHQGEP